jgi:hypothetical protein
MTASPDNSKKAGLEEQVFSALGDLCTIADRCVVFDDGPGASENPPRTFTDSAKLHAAYEAVRSSTDKLHGRDHAEEVYRVLLSLPVRYNARLTRAIGRAKFVYEMNGWTGTKEPQAYEIELTAAYEIPESYLPRLLVHEACHVARAVINPVGFRREDPHGPAWQALMVAAGEEPRAKCIDPEIAAQARKRAGHPEGALDQSQVNVGDRVSFIGGKKRGRITGAVVQKTAKGAMIKDDSGGSWRVGYGLLIKEQP